eukprot:69902-Rhodomonas_salina.1
MRATRRERSRRIAATYCEITTANAACVAPYTSSVPRRAYSTTTQTLAQYCQITTANAACRSKIR